MKSDFDIHPDYVLTAFTVILDSSGLDLMAVFFLKTQVVSLKTPSF